MSNRWLRTDFLKCMKCMHLQRYVSGYKPIPNPILFQADEHCRAWSREQKNAIRFVDSWKFIQCESCKKLHGDWKWLDFQRYIAEKEKLAAGGRKFGSAHADLSARSDDGQAQHTQIAGGR